MLFSEEAVTLNDMAYQRNVNVLLEPIELEQSLDDLSERVLLPCANMLALNLRESGAAVCFRLNLPERAKRPDLHCSVHQYNGFSIRCLMEDPRYGMEVPPHEVGLYRLRFDVLFRTKREPQISPVKDSDPMWEAVVAASA